MARNDLRARGGLGGGGAKRPHQLGVGVARSATPTASIYIYIYIYISIYIHRWDIGTQLQWRVTNMARNDLRTRGGLGGREAPPPTRCWGGAKRHPNS